MAGTGNGTVVLTGAPGDKPYQPAPASPWSVPAIITYALLLIWILTAAGMYNLIVGQVQINSVYVGILGTILGTDQTLLVAAISFWVGTTSGAKSSGDALAKSNEAGSSALAQLAGAGPQPPALPMKGDGSDGVSPGDGEQITAGGGEPKAGGAGGAGDPTK